MEDFDSGRTLVLPEEGRGLDPEEIARAVREAGFTPAKLEVRAEGILETSGEGLALRVDGIAAPFVLEGEAVDGLRRKAGTRIRITGALTLSKGKAPHLAVESFE